jgi:uncharacterized repeat protein (TIGR01451 family)
VSTLPMRDLVAALALTAFAPLVEAAVFPTNPNVEFQTSGCQRGPTVGDWYTASATASGTRYGEFFLEVTGGMTPATVVIVDAESAGALDEVLNADDPTRFELRSGDGATLLAGETVPAGSPDGTEVTFPALAEGLYRIRSYTGSDEAPDLATGSYCDQAAGDNDDDNGFRIQVNGASAQDGLLGFLQTTYQQSSGAGLDYQMYFLVGPDTTDTTLRLRNFDLDNGAGGAVYNRAPDASGTAVSGSVSANGSWNGGGSLDSGQDEVTANDDLASGAVEAGIWGYRIESWTSGNQTIFEANDGGSRLALTDTLPTRAGFFTLTATGTLGTAVGVPVDHPFTVTNQFFSNDVINFALSGTAAGYTPVLMSDPNCDGSAADGVALVDNDGDGAVDSGLLTIFGTAGASKCYALRMTAAPAASGPDTTTISAVSFMDARVGAANTVRTITKTTTLTPSPVTIASSVVVISDPLHGTTSPSKIPGAVLEYTVTVTNPGGGVVSDSLVIGDLVPTGTTYVAGSLKVAGVGEDDDAAGGDESDPNGGDVGVTTAGTVTGTLPTLASGASTTLVFRVTIN